MTGSIPLPNVLPQLWRLQSIHNQVQRFVKWVQGPFCQLPEGWGKKKDEDEKGNQDDENKDGDDEFLPTRGPPRPRRSGTRPRRKRTEKKAATRVAFNICQMRPKRERSVLILASHITDQVK